MKKKHLINSNEIKVSDMIDNLVYTLDNGKKIGRIIKITFDHQSKKVSSLIVKESLWSKKLVLVKTEHIKNLVRDMVNISSAKYCIPIVDLAHLINMTFQNIDRHRVITDEGKLLGIIDDMIVSQKTYTILGFILNEDSLLKVNSNQIILGRDEIIVPKCYENKIIENSQETIFSKYIHFRSHEEIAKDKEREHKRRHRVDFEEKFKEEIDF